MKKMMIAGMVMMLGAAAFLMFGCASTRIKQVDGGEFLKQAEIATALGSFAQTSYIGSTYDRVYLEYGHPAFIGRGMQVTVIWAPISELPSNVVAKIKKGVRPWTNAMDRIGQQGAAPLPSAPVVPSEGAH